MLRQLYYRFRHGPYLKNAHGIKKFAERAMGQLIRKVTKKSAFYREQNENLLVEKANLRLRAAELREQPMLSAGEFFSMRRRMWANKFIAVAFVTAAVFLNALSAAAFIGAAAVPSTLVLWLTAVTTAIVLTGGGMLVMEYLIEALYPAGRTERPVWVRDPGRLEAVLWGAFVIAFELVILCLADAQARRLAAGAEGGALLYTGYVALSMLLPLIAGAVRWDTIRYTDVYETTHSLREIDVQLAQTDSILRQNEEYESNFYKVKSITYWDRLNEFKTLKDNYNERQGISEPLGGHFAQSYDAFQKEAGKRYNADIRDVTAKSMRKLEQPEARTGHKLGQASDGGSSLRRPTAASASDGNGRAATAESNGTYQELQPVR